MLNSDHPKQVVCSVYLMFACWRKMVCESDEITSKLISLHKWNTKQTLKRLYWSLSFSLKVMLRNNKCYYGIKNNTERCCAWISPDNSLLYILVILVSCPLKRLQMIKKGNMPWERDCFMYSCDTMKTLLNRYVKDIVTIKRPIASDKSLPEKFSLKNCLTFGISYWEFSVDVFSLLRSL